MIATALALDPSVVIMDEPTTALDVVTQREILEELMTLRDRLDFAVLFISHDLSLLVEIADSIAVMYAGRLVERADANAIFRAPRHPYSLGLLSSFPALHGPRLAMEGIPGSPPDLRNMPSGCPFHPRCGYAFDRCRTDPAAAAGPGRGHPGGRVLAAGRPRWPCPPSWPGLAPAPAGHAGPGGSRREGGHDHRSRGPGPRSQRGQRRHAGAGGARPDQAFPGAPARRRARAPRQWCTRSRT